MKFVKIYLALAFVFSLTSSVFSVEEENMDSDLAGVLETMVRNLHYIPNPKFPNLPTETDLQHLEDRLKPGCKLPPPLKQYHLTCGNKIFKGGVRFPTVHQREDGKCNLLDFIEKGRNKGIPFIQEGQINESPLGNWLAFGEEDGSTYVCMEVETQKVCYFSFVPNFKKDKKEYESLSSWIKERLLSQ